MRTGGDGDHGAGAPATRLAGAVPVEARRVLVLGPEAAGVADALATRHPAPSVRLAHDPAALDPAPGGHLDTGAEPVDCIVYHDVLPRVADPVQMLRQHRAMLSPDGSIVCSVPNLQHHSVLRHLVRGCFPYVEGTLLDPSYRHLFTSAGVMQALLDAGYAPDTVERLEDGGDDAMAGAGAALFELLGVGATDAERDLRTATLIVRGTLLDDVSTGPEEPVTFVACVNDDEQLGANLARSPCFAPGAPHELLVFRGCASAAEGLNAGMAAALHDFVVLLHQDVYVPAAWPARMVAQWRLAATGGGPVGIAGVFGVLDRGVPFDAVGRVVHRDRLLSHRRLPADVDGLDELLMVVHRPTPLRVDPDLGWHLYGTDLALQAQQHGLRVVVLDAPCHHNSLTGRVPSSYRDSERVLAGKWEQLLPIHTNLSSVDRWLLAEAGSVDATPGPGAAPAPRDAAAAPATGPGADPTGKPAKSGVQSPPTDPVADIVTRLRREQVALSTELEQARLQVASIQASPFWRARQAAVAVRDRLRRPASRGNGRKAP